MLNINIFSIGRLWPLIIVTVGLCFEVVYFSTRKNVGLLVPGGILTTIGLLFTFESLTNWHFAAYTWPIYPLSVAIGLFQLYIFDKREKLLLIPIGILVIVPAVSFSSMVYGRIFRIFDFRFILAGILVLIGLTLILKETSNKEK